MSTGNRYTRMAAAAALAFVITVPVMGQAIPTGVTFERVHDASKYWFTHPTFIGPIPGNPTGLIIVERAGQVSRLEGTGTTMEKKEWFKVDANTATHWDGAWVVEFHPKFAENHLFYVLYRRKTPDTKSVIEEWTCNADLSDPKKVRDIITFTQAEIHSSGDVKFGPDGFLYTSQGDRNTGGWAQDTKDLYGKVSRIDVNKKDPGKEYAIPADNPFVGQSGIRPEIWAIGFRVPYRISFDKLNGDLYLGDVGDTKNEEVNLVVKGKNYGATTCEGPCTNAGFTNPLLALPRGCMIGGFVYRNDPQSQFYGVYIFADYQRSEVRGLKINPDKSLAENKDIAAQAPGNVSSMGLDGMGNFYLSTYVENGTDAAKRTHIWRLKHAELRPASVSVAPQARPGKPATLNDLTSSQYRAYSLEGKENAKATAKSVLILRDVKTGEKKKFIQVR